MPASWRLSKSHYLQAGNLCAFLGPCGASWVCDILHPNKEVLLRRSVRGALHPSRPRRSPTFEPFLPQCVRSWRRSSPATLVPHLASIFARGQSRVRTVAPLQDSSSPSLTWVQARRSWFGLTVLLPRIACGHAKVRCQCFR